MPPTEYGNTIPRPTSVVGENGDITEVKGIGEAPSVLSGVSLDFGEHGSAARKPDKEGHTLQNQSTLTVTQGKALGIVSEEVAKHIDHKHHRADGIQGCSSDGVPEALCICTTS
jgi:hypothetical protein